ncbi:MAG: isochorismatase family protein [Ilumatobacteraceae bacterium]|nr:isochorismatase family protein [Ilumatobacteraceae bacterium]
MNEPQVSPNVLESVVGVRGRVHVVDRLDAARTALIVIDMQNFFVEPGQMLEVPAARGIVGNINRLAAATRSAGGTVVWVRMTLDHDELAMWSVFLPVNGTAETRHQFESLEHDKPAHRLWPELQTRPDDLYVDKTRFSAFIQGSSDLQALLIERGIDTLLIVGTLTNVCCESTGRDAMMLNYRVVMVDDANATINEAMHRATLDNFLTFFGDVQTTDQVLALL